LVASPWSLGFSRQRCSLAYPICARKDEEHAANYVADNRLGPGCDGRLLLGLVRRRRLRSHRLGRRHELPVCPGRSSDRYRRLQRCGAPRPIASLMSARISPRREGQTRDVRPVNDDWLPNQHWGSAPSLTANLQHGDHLLSAGKCGERLLSTQRGCQRRPILLSAPLLR
jgi:hypothetical protein